MTRPPRSRAVGRACGALLRASRPKTLPAAATPVLVGSAAAAVGGGFRVGPAAAALVGALLIQIGTNLFNDALDYEKGADTAERVGPLRVTQAGLLTGRQVKLAAAAAFILATAAGAYLTAVAGWPVVVIGVASILAGLAYTAGPAPLAYRGLGDPFVFLFFGFVAVCGTTFVQLGRVTLLALVAAVPVGALATAILVVNNVRDIESDQRAGRRTLPVAWGRKAGVIEFAALLAAAHLVPLAFIAAGALSGWIALPLAAAPAAALLVGELHRQRGAALNFTLGRTAGLLLVHGALLAAGMLAGAAQR